MKNKTVAHYFESAKRLPVSVSMADVRLMVSTHVIPPKTTKWWNFNNFLIMTATISIISAIVMMTISNEAKEIKYNYEPVKIELVSPLDTYSNYFKPKRLIEEEVAQAKTIDVIDTPINSISSNNYAVPIKAQLPNVSPISSIKMPVVSLGNLEIGEMDAEMDGFEGFDLFEMEEDDSIVNRIFNIKGESKTMTKSISANGINLFLLHNNNGQIDISIWNEPNIEVTAIFTIETDNEDDEKKALADFTFELESKSDQIEVKTNWDDVQNCNCTNSRKRNKVKTDAGDDIEFKQFNISYQIKAPKDMSYDLKNTYANINMEDVFGSLTAVLFKGDLNVGNIKDEINISMKYGNAAIKDFGKGGEVTLFKSSLSGKSAQKLKLKSNYSSVSLGKLEELDIVGFKSSFNFSNTISKLHGSVKYGSFSIAGNVKSLEMDGFKSSFSMKDIGNAKLALSYSSLNANNGGEVKVTNAFKSTINLNTISGLEGAFKYSPLSIKEITNNIELTTFKGDVSISEVGEAFSAVEIEGKYSNINIQFHPKSSYNLNASSNYSSINVPNVVSEFIVQNGSNSSLNHFIGNESTRANGVASTVTVNLFQGNLNIK